MKKKPSAAQLRARAAFTKMVKAKAAARRATLTDEEIVDRDREERRWRVELAHDDVMREEYAPARSYTGASNPYKKVKGEWQRSDAWFGHSGAPKEKTLGIQQRARAGVRELTDRQLGLLRTEKVSPGWGELSRKLHPIYRAAADSEFAKRQKRIAKQRRSRGNPKAGPGSELKRAARSKARAMTEAELRVAMSRTRTPSMFDLGGVARADLSQMAAHELLKRRKRMSRVNGSGSVSVRIAGLPTSGWRVAGKASHPGCVRVHGHGKTIDVPAKFVRRSNPSSTAEVRKAYEDFHWGEKSTGGRPVKVPKPRGPLMQIGTLHSVVYSTTKGGQKDTWEHEFKKKPILASDRNHKLFVVGGNYRVKPEGITG